MYNRSRSSILDLESRFGVRAATSTVGGVEICTMTPRRVRPDDAYAIYLHGGGYMLGDARDELAVLMADELEMPLHSVQYRLAPEAPFPAALDDAIAAYTEIVTKRQGKFVLLGASAGGGLALALMQRIRQLGLPEPSGLGLLAPWTDLARVGSSRHCNEGRDPVIRWRGQLDKAARAYAASASVTDPLISPVHSTNLCGLPPSIIIAGTRDLFLSDCVRMHRALRSAGVQSDFRVWEGMWHTFIDLPDIPEAIESRAEIAAFLRETLTASVHS
ncbi:alpha/beta hydrolase [Nocardia heshunensis]